MMSLCRVAPLALVLLPMLGLAQVRSLSAVGLEIPAPASPKQGHFLTGTYVSRGHTPALATNGAGSYTVQPYLRYVLGPGNRLRPFVQYSLPPFRVQQGYGRAFPLYGPGGGEPSFNPSPAPFVARNLAYSGVSYGGLGVFSVGISMHTVRGSVLLDLGGSVLSGMFLNMLR